MNRGVHWLASYPKSGNTWVRALLSNYFSESDEPVPINKLRFGFQATARDWIDEKLGFESADLPPEYVESLRPALLHDLEEDHLFCKTHEQFQPHFQSAAGVVLVVRNPLDVAVSMARFFGIPLDDAIRRIGSEKNGTGGADHLEEDIPVCWGSWSSHAVSWLDSGLPLYVVRYEQLLADPLTELEAILRFSGLSITEKRLQFAVKHSSLSSLQGQEREAGFREAVLGSPAFFRNGKAEAWLETFDRAQIERVVATHEVAMRRLGYEPAHFSMD